MSKDVSSTGPTLFKAFLELRSLVEAFTSATFHPVLKRLPRGDGHPVVLVPAFMTGDGGTAMMRNYLKSAGYTVYGWEQGRNVGLRKDLLDGFTEHVRQISERHGNQTVSLIGWSLGGVYARALAAQNPKHVRQVITLGSPFNTSNIDNISGMVAKLYEKLNPGGLTDPILEAQECWQKSPPVPSTAIYSLGDGIAPWHHCVDEPGHQTENVCVPGSHMGLTHNVAVMFAVAERLAQPEGKWKPFSMKWISVLYRNKGVLPQGALPA